MSFHFTNEYRQLNEKFPVQLSEPPHPIFCGCVRRSREVIARLEIKIVFYFVWKIFIRLHQEVTLISLPLVRTGAPPSGFPMRWEVRRGEERLGSVLSSPEYNVRLSCVTTPPHPAWRQRVDHVVIQVWCQHPSLVKIIISLTLPNPHLPSSPVITILTIPPQKLRATFSFWPEVPRSRQSLLSISLSEPNIAVPFSLIIFTVIF